MLHLYLLHMTGHNSDLLINSNTTSLTNKALYMQDSNPIFISIYKYQLFHLIN